VPDARAETLVRRPRLRQTVLAAVVKYPHRLPPPLMREVIRGSGRPAAPYATDAAEEAMRAEGLEPVRIPIRGGTDGSLLSEMGLPTPNIFTGGHEFHSVREWASVQDMAASAATIIRLAEVWTRPQFVAAAATNGR